MRESGECEADAASNGERGIGSEREEDGGEAADGGWLSLSLS